MSATNDKTLVESVDFPVLGLGPTEIPLTGLLPKALAASLATPLPPLAPSGPTPPNPGSRAVAKAARKQRLRAQRRRRRRRVRAVVPVTYVYMDIDKVYTDYLEAKRNAL